MSELVKNASDPRQVQHARRKDRDKRVRELRDLQTMLALPEGRRFLWRLLGHCRVNESIWHPSALIHHNSGMQDVGHFIQAEIVDANEDAYFTMMKEARAERAGDAIEAEAVRTASVSDQRE